MKNKAVVVVVGYIMVMSLIFLIYSFSKSKDNKQKTTEVPKSTEEFMLTNKMKAKLENYCYFLQELDSTQDFTSEYMHDFIFYMYTGSGMEEYEKVTVNTPNGDINMLKIPEAEVLSQFNLLFGVNMPEYKPAKDTEDISIYYEEGFYYIRMSDFGDIYYQYSREERDANGVFVVIKKVLPEVTEEMRIELEQSNNQNGFIIKSYKKISE